ncbi:unnamed protein product [Calypogeia fissa]
MSSVAGLFWFMFCVVARKFLAHISESKPKEYCQQLEIVHLVEALYKLHTVAGDLEPKYSWVTDRQLLANFFLDKQGNVMPIEEVLSKIPLSRYELARSRLLSWFVVCEVVARGMDHG